MRITDAYIMNSYLRTLNQNKLRLERLQKELSTLNRIHNLSDSPEAIPRIIRFKESISHTELYTKNIQNGLASLNTAIDSMEMMDPELINVLTVIAESKNPTNQNFTSFADRIDAALKSLLSLANRSFDGKYLFGGTDFSKEPFSYSEGNAIIGFNTSSISGIHKIKIGNNITQQINVNGAELFASILKAGGNLPELAPSQTVSVSQTTVYDAHGNEYTMTTAYTKTGGNTYSLNYDITDSEGNSIFTSPPQPKTLVFNNGKLQSVDNAAPVPFEIVNEQYRIKFAFDLTGLTETSSPESLSFQLNRKSDIFNVLAAIRDNFMNGVLPSEQQKEMIEFFRKDLLNKTSEAGNRVTIMTNSEESLVAQNARLKKLLSDETDVDVAKAVMELQNQDYLLQLSYKVAAMILPKSLMDFL